jgi:hypothetical protein
MRRTVVWIAMIGALGVLALRLWPAPDGRRHATVITPPAQAAPPRVVQLAGTWDTIDEQTCAGPALREITKHPNWKLTLQEREWDDVADDNPDELIATVTIDAQTASWADGDLPQSIELTREERAQLLEAAERSCARIRPGNGHNGYYVTLSYGPVEHEAIELPSDSRAAIDAIAVFDRVRARYVANRLSSAQVMKLTLTGPRRIDAAWKRHTVTVHSDGRVTDEDGQALEPLAALDLVDVLDWSLQLPTSARGKNTLTGTLEIAGSKKPVALQLESIQKLPSAWRSPFLTLLNQWWRYNLDP